MRCPMQALHHACSQDNDSIVKLMLKHSANIEAVDSVSTCVKEISINCLLAHSVSVLARPSLVTPLCTTAAGRGICEYWKRCSSQVR